MLIRRFHEAKLTQTPEVYVWGTGRPRREFLYVDDMAAASVFMMNIDKVLLESKIKPMMSHINIGYGADITIHELAKKIAKVVGYKGAISFDHSKPDGVMQKLMDSRLANQLGWSSIVDLECGLSLAYEDFKTRVSSNLGSK
jgi:GDP-L-fucose synthase